MWFGVAPAPSPSRTSRKEWHPNLCTCAKHRKANEKVLDQKVSATAVISPRTSAGIVSPTKELVSPRMREQQHVKSSPRVRSSLKKISQPFAWNTQLLPIPPPANFAVPNTEPRATLKHDANYAQSPEITRDRHVKDKSDVDDTSGGEFNVNTPANTEPTLLASADNEPPQRVTMSRRASRERRGTPNSTTVDDNHDELRFEPTLLSLSLPPPSRSRRSGSSFSIILPQCTEFATRTERPACPSPMHIHPENLVGHTSSVCALHTEDDRYIISCSIDGSVKIWSKTTFACLHTLYGHEDNVSCVDLNGQWLVCGSHDTTLRVYSCHNNFKHLHILRGHTAHVTKVLIALSIPTHVFSCSDDASIRLWDAEKGSCLLILRTHTSRITCFLLQGDQICSGAADAAICFWRLHDHDTHSGQEIRCSRIFCVHKATIQCIVPASTMVNQPLLFTGSNDGTIQLFNFKTMQHIGRFDTVHSPIYTLVPLLNGTLICSTGDGKLLLYKELFRSYPHMKTELQLAPKWISSLQPCGEIVACSSEDFLYIVNVHQLRIKAVLETNHSFVNCVRWLHSETLITAGQDNVIKVWDLT